MAERSLLVRGRQLDDIKGLDNGFFLGVEQQLFNSCQCRKCWPDMASASFAFDRDFMRRDHPDSELDCAGSGVSFDFHNRNMAWAACGVSSF